MKKNILSLLHEKITLLATNCDITHTTVQKFKDTISSRALIRPVNGQKHGIYEIVLPIPSNAQGKEFNGIKWNNIEYECVSEFKIYKEKYLKGIVRQLDNNL
jgi:coenzyme F420-reducing hydrogenase alpha subunit